MTEMARMFIQTSQIKKVTIISSRVVTLIFNAKHFFMFVSSAVTTPIIVLVTLLNQKRSSSQRYVI